MAHTSAAPSIPTTSQTHKAPSLQANPATESPLPRTSKNPPAAPGPNQTPSQLAAAHRAPSPATHAIPGSPDSPPTPASANYSTSHTEYSPPDASASPTPSPPTSAHTSKDSFHKKNRPRPRRDTASTSAADPSNAAK